MIDYEQLYFNEVYKNKKLIKEIEQLKQEIEILKGNKTLIEFILKEVSKHKEDKE